MATWIATRPRRTLLALALLAAVGAVSCWMPDGDVSFSDDERAAVATAVRSILEGGDPASVSVILPGSLRKPAERAAFVTVYAEGDKAAAGGRGESAGAAVVEAARRLAESPAWLKLRAQHAGSGLTIDIVSARSSLPTTHPEIAPLFLDPGVDGVYAAGDGYTAYLLPATIYLEGIDPDGVAGRVVAGEGIRVPGEDGPRGRARRFRTETIGQAAQEAPAVRLSRSNWLVPAVGSKDLKDACVRGGYALLHMQRSDGRFYYMYYAGTDRNYRNAGEQRRDEYNYLRHAGTTYALFQLYGATGEEAFRDAAERAARWMLRFVRDAPDGSFAYPWYDRESKLGGAGLALLALVEREESTGRSDLRPVMEKLAAFIVSMQHENGDFDSYYQPDPRKKAKVRKSIYYPGEAILALVRLHALTGDPRWLAAVVKGADYLVHDRWNLLGVELTIPPDAWLMLALADLYPFRPDRTYADYCFAVGDFMIGGQIGERVSDAPDYLGGYLPAPPAITPAGSRMEGLTAGFRLKERIGEDTSGWLDAVRRAALFQVNAQIRPETAYLFPAPEKALGVFRNPAERQTVAIRRTGSRFPVPYLNTGHRSLHATRIDYNQHNISGLLVAAEILAERGL